MSKPKKKSGAKPLIGTAGVAGKSGRFARRKAYYAGGVARTGRNKLKRARRHARAHPHDALARALIKELLLNLGLSSKGRKREARRTGR